MYYDIMVHQTVPQDDHFFQYRLNDKSFYHKYGFEELVRPICFKTYS